AHNTAFEAHGSALVAAPVQPALEVAGKRAARLMGARRGRRSARLGRSRHGRAGPGGAGHLGEEARILPGGEARRGVGDGVEQRFEPGGVSPGEIVEHVAQYLILVAWMANADAHAPVLIADVGRDRAQSVVAGIAAAGFDPKLAWREVELV